MEEKASRIPKGQIEKDLRATVKGLRAEEQVVLLRRVTIVAARFLLTAPVSGALAQANAESAVRPRKLTLILCFAPLETL